MKRFIFSCIVALMLCLCCFGCATAPDTASYEGEWELSSGSLENLDEESVTFAKDLGNTVLLTLDDEGTGTLNLYGDISDLEWEVIDDEQATLTVDGSSQATMTTESEVLTITDDNGNSLVFIRA